MAYKVVADFESRIAEYAGSKYAVAVESCTAALLLSCVYRKVGEVTIPRNTYPGVACSIIHAGGTVKFSDEQWAGTYKLAPYDIVDGALRFRRGMYEGGLHCLSFHVKKSLSIGRGGMVLTDDAEAAEWLRIARFDGRHALVPLNEDNFTIVGYNAYLTPEQAARGIQIFEMIKSRDIPDIAVAEQNYPDLSQHAAFKSKR